MRKVIHYDERAIKELKEFSKEVQKDFVAVIEVLEREGRIIPPEAKKISKNLFEVRVLRGGSYRGFYAYARYEYVVILHFFQKKSQKTPIKNIKVAERRFRDYE